MTLNELNILVNTFIIEYTGIGASGGNSTDGNDITSPRPFPDDASEIRNYINKNVYGAEGGHYRKDKYTGNYPNRQKMPLFEVKNYIKKYIKERAYSHATLTTQGPPRTRTRIPTDEYPFSALPKRTATGMMEQLTPGEMATYNRKKVGYQKKIADVDIEIARKNKEAINAQLQQQTAALGPQLDNIEKQLYDTNQIIADKKGERGIIRRNINRSQEAFDEIDLEDEEARQSSLEALQGLETSLDTVEDEIKKSTEQRRTISQQRDQILKQKSQAQAQAQVSLTQANKAIRDQQRAMRNIGKTMQENIIKQYFKKRKNINLMEQMDMYKKQTKSSLKQFFEMFEKGKTNEEVLRHYAEKGISIPETYITKAKKYFENYKKLQLELGFMEQEAKDFKKSPVLEDEPTENKQLASGLFKEYIKKELINLKK